MYRGILTVVLLLFHVAAWAQCAMCRATLENNVSEGDIGIAAKLNVGILYLFAMPYLLAVVIGFLWYRQSKRNAQKLAMAERIKNRIQSIHAR
ncbi:MAG TPA: hypothetical protein DDY13_00770 [Cytophagales bacterium]|nr:hypothetical protein [Cytophagales bacterium]